MKRATIAKRIVLGYATLIAIAVSFGAFNYLNLAGIGAICSNSNRLTKSSMTGIGLVQGIGSEVREIYLLTLKHRLTDDPDKGAAILGAIRADLEKLNALCEAYEKTGLNQRDRRLLQVIKDARGPYASASVNVLTSDPADLKGAMTVVERQLTPAYDRYLAAIDAAIAAQQVNADESGVKIMSAVASGRLGILAGLGLAIVTAMIVAYSNVRSVRSALLTILSRLRSSSREVSRVASRMVETSRSLAVDASKQEASLEQTVATIGETAGMTRRNADHASQATGLAKRAREAAEKGAAAVRVMNAAMSATKASSDRVAKIVKSIDEIALQTNILALNAAVEAARAGAAGVGFAVVAEEVRNLAQRSATAAKESTAKIEDTLAKTAQSFETSATVGAVLDDIVLNARQVDELASKVSANSQDQRRTHEELSATVKEIEKVTHLNVLKAEQASTAADNLNEQAAELRTALQDLSALIEGSNESSKSWRKTANHHAEDADAEEFVPAGSPAAAASPNRQSSGEPAWLAPGKFPGF